MYAYLPDFLLLFVTSLTCLYCVMLSRRLKKLQNLDGGLGASIVTLTQAITKTSIAAQEARQSTEHSVKELKQLLRSAEDLLPQIEARMESLRNTRKTADQRFEVLDEILTTEIDPALQKAQKMSRSLLQTVRVVMAYERRTSRGKPAPKSQLQTPQTTAPQGKAA